MHSVIIEAGNCIYCGKHIGNSGSVFLCEECRRKEEEMSKYVIEVEDVPFSKVRIDADNGAQNINLYRAKGFNALVFDKEGLDKLTQLDKELEEAYQKGKHDAEQDLARAAYAEAYQHGLEDAWEAAKKICTNWMISDQTLAEIFGQCKDIDTIMHENTAQEAIDKIKSYETKQETDKIVVGDEVRSDNAMSEELKPCPFRVHGERLPSLTIEGAYYYNETFMPCMGKECPCYDEAFHGNAFCRRNGANMIMAEEVTK